MGYLFHHLLSDQAHQRPTHSAVAYKSVELSYADLWQQVQLCAQGFKQLDLSRHDRVAVFLPKQPETVISLFAASAAGGCFVPVNPVLKPPQVSHILQDCNARVLISNRSRAQQLLPELIHCHDLRCVVLTDADQLDSDQSLPFQVLPWHTLMQPCSATKQSYCMTDQDLAAILYTSGSTGRPKGVILSHRNLVVGAQSVAGYIGNHDQDRILALLPLSFDAGLSQITTAFASGACCVLLDYLLPNDVLKTVVAQRITGITAVPPLWHQIAGLKWTPDAATSIRYFANTGGHMNQALLQQLRDCFPEAKPFLMYGLTEAFRSTYLPPEDVVRKPGSIGKAIPNAEVLVLREDGSECQANEVGELVHRGPLVSQGYWNDPQRTAERFKPIPKVTEGEVFDELAVWSGDSVKRDDEGYLYFVGRRDEMIKTSGYRVSPSEIEEIAYGCAEVEDAVALGLAHPTLGQGILLLVSSSTGSQALQAELLQRCRSELPNFMVPQAIRIHAEPLPRNPNGKFDRTRLSTDYSNQFSPADGSDT